MQACGCRQAGLGNRPSERDRGGRKWGFWGLLEWNFCFFLAFWPWIVHNNYSIAAELQTGGLKQKRPKVF